jgi:hypothetical protein
LDRRNKAAQRQLSSFAAPHAVWHRFGVKTQNSGDLLVKIRQVIMVGIRLREVIQNLLASRLD